MDEKDQLKKDVAVRLRQVRRSMSLTQGEISDHFDTGRANYSRNEKGETFPNPVLLYTLCTRFGISLDWLIAGKGPRTREEKRKMEEPPADSLVVNSEIKEMVTLMTRVPFLLHELLARFYHFKFDYKEVIEESLKERK
jgi:transcriptional regulator with XRE-family HTH domain